MSLVKHRLQLTLQLPAPEVKNLNLIPFMHPLKSKTTASHQGQEVVSKSNLLNDLEKLCVLGHGNYGTVYKVRHRQTSAIYALKIIRGEADTSQPSQEMEILLSTDSPFIVKCHGTYASLAEEKAILMEYMDAGTLDSLLKTNGPFSESLISHVAYQVLSGLNYLHAFKIVHLDIKPSNLLVDKKMNVKIGDFGVSKVIREDEPSDYWDIYAGTYAYMSPERLDSNMFDLSKCVYSADIWSLGVTLLELYVGHFPFLPPGKKPNWMQLVLITSFESEAPSLPKEASEEFKSFINCCLQKKPKNRWTALQLLSHPFICRQNRLKD